MRLITLILVSGILLFYPNLLLALNQEQKTKILVSEWKEALAPKTDVPEVKEIQNQQPKEKLESPKPELPLVFGKKITLRSSGVSLKTLIAKVAEVTGYNVVYDPEVEIGRASCRERV